MVVIENSPAYSYKIRHQTKPLNTLAVTHLLNQSPRWVGAVRWEEKQGLLKGQYRPNP